MHHAVAEKPVMAFRIALDRVWADTEVGTVKLPRDRSAEGEIVDAQFLLHGRMDPAQEGMRPLGNRKPLAIEGADPLRAPPHDRSHHLLHGARHHPLRCMPHARLHAFDSDPSGISVGGGCARSSWSG